MPCFLLVFIGDHWWLIYSVLPSWLYFGIAGYLGALHAKMDHASPYPCGIVLFRVSAGLRLFIPVLQSPAGIPGCGKQPPPGRNRSPCRPGRIRGSTPRPWKTTSAVSGQVLHPVLSKSTGALDFDVSRPGRHSPRACCGQQPDHQRRPARLGRNPGAGMHGMRPTNNSFVLNAWAWYSTLGPWP